MAALTLCSEGEVSGLVVTKMHTVEVLPMRLSEHEFVVETITSRVNHLHLVRRIKEVNVHEKNSGNDESMKDQETEEHEYQIIEPIIQDPHSKTTNLSKRVLEIAVFLDATAYKRCAKQYLIFYK